MDILSNVYICWDYSDIECHILCLKLCVLLGSGDVNIDGWWPYNSMAFAWHRFPGWRPRDRWRTSTRSLTASELYSSAGSVSAYWQWTATWWPLRLPTYVVPVMDTLSSRQNGRTVLCVNDWIPDVLLYGWFCYCTAWKQGGLVARKVSICLSVCLSVSNTWIVTKRKIFILYKRSFSIVFWEKEWLVGGAITSTWNFGSTGPHWSEIADFEPIFARTASAVTPSEKVPLTLIGSRQCAFQWT